MHFYFQGLNDDAYCDRNLERNAGCHFEYGGWLKYVCFCISFWLQDFFRLVWMLFPPNIPINLSVLPNPFLSDSAPNFYLKVPSQLSPNHLAYRSAFSAGSLEVS
jgi:hypothetical protein